MLYGGFVTRQIDGVFESPSHGDDPPVLTPTPTPK